METQHTKGKWTIELESDGNIHIVIPGEIETIANVSSGFSEMSGKYEPTLEEKANAKLIAAASLILKELMLTYLRLQSEAIKDMKFAVITDYMRASLLNKICAITGFDDQEYQYKIECIAQDLRDGKIELKEAIQKATE